MKITPINFTAYLEPALKSYWKERSDSVGKVEIRRSHDLRLNQTVINSITVDDSEQVEVLCSIQLADIPQKENYPAIKTNIHLPHLQRAQQYLMVFKTEADPQLWTNKIISFLRLNPPVTVRDEEVEEPVSKVVVEESELESE